LRDASGLIDLLRTELDSLTQALDAYRANS
jgi:hypothetical protein